mmetsp:Transcript_7932/g.25061  ORF Transcript_7932/g.25061 Transcript_7932/m.25061 type:complete len:269 (-) Transcript_7932:816-1622(-)
MTTRGVTTRRKAATSLPSGVSSSSTFVRCSTSLRRGTTRPWLFFHRTEHRSASLKAPSSPDGSATSSTDSSLTLRVSPSEAFGPPPPRRAQKTLRWEGSPLSFLRRVANSCLPRPPKELVCARGTACRDSASSSSSLSSISTLTGPGEASGWCSSCFSLTCLSSSQEALVFSYRSRASLSFGKSRSASSKSRSASLHLCRARSAAARRTKALKHASELFSKPSSKISAYSMTLLQEPMASRQRKTFSSARALFVHSALQSRLYSRPSS